MCAMAAWAVSANGTLPKEMRGACRAMRDAHDDVLDSATKSVVLSASKPGLRRRLAWMGRHLHRVRKLTIDVSDMCSSFGWETDDDGDQTFTRKDSVRFDLRLVPAALAARLWTLELIGDQYDVGVRICGLSALSRFTNLINLTMFAVEFPGRGPSFAAAAAAAPLNKLGYLDLGMCRGAVGSLEDLAKLSKLWYLDLNYAATTEIEHLNDIGHTFDTQPLEEPIVVDIWHPLGRLSKLKFLRLATPYLVSKAFLFSLRSLSGLDKLRFLTVDTQSLPGDAQLQGIQEELTIIRS